MQRIAKIPNHISTVVFGLFLSAIKLRYLYDCTVISKPVIAVAPVCARARFD